MLGFRDFQPPVKVECKEDDSNELIEPDKVWKFADDDFELHGRQPSDDGIKCI